MLERQKHYTKVEKLYPTIPEFIACVCSDTNGKDDDTPETPRPETKTQSYPVTEARPPIVVERKADMSASKAQDGPA